MKRNSKLSAHRSSAVSIGSVSTPSMTSSLYEEEPSLVGPPAFVEATIFMFAGSELKKILPHKEAKYSVRVSIPAFDSPQQALEAHFKSAHIQFDPRWVVLKSDTAKKEDLNTEVYHAEISIPEQYGKESIVCLFGKDYVSVPRNFKLN